MRLNELLGIEFPFIQGGMANIATGEFAAAVSNAWALGLVWGKWMPDTFLGKPMTSPWIYSLIYNGSYMLPSIVLCLVVFALLYKSLRKYFTSADLLAA